MRKHDNILYFQIILLFTILAVAVIYSDELHAAGGVGFFNELGECTCIRYRYNSSLNGLPNAHLGGDYKWVETGGTTQSYGYGMEHWSWNGTNWYQSYSDWYSFRAVPDPTAFWEKVVPTNPDNQVCGNVYYTALQKEWCAEEEPEPEVDCSEKEGETVKLSLEGMYPQGPFCIEGCQAEETPQGEVDILAGVYDFANNITYTSATFNGQECSEGDREEDDYPSCDDMSGFCAQMCSNMKEVMDLQCDDEGGFISCGCTMPDFPVIQDGGELKPDQDKDGIPSESDPDVDGDGEPNETDPDIDGDGHENKDDADIDGDGTDNRGNKEWTNDDFTGTWGGGYQYNHNGDGSDPNVDGDGQPNGSDNDVDGDGIPNDRDSDIDGDGVPNDRDVDVDGDGNLNSGDGDADGDGIGNDEDNDPTGSFISTNDTNDDGELDGTDDPINDDPPPDLDTTECPEGEICIGDGVCQDGESSTSTDCMSDGQNYLQNRWDDFQNNITSTGLFQFVDIGDLPSSSDSIVDVNLGNLGGQKTFNLAEFNFAWAIINGIFTVMFSWLGIKIILLKQA